jgi:hypothetical protein
MQAKNKENLNPPTTKTTQPAQPHKPHEVKGSLANPTAFFFQQATTTNTEYKEKIDEFVGKLLNLKQCVLCRGDYNFSTRIPRILIHCGHTFCSSCLKNFYRNMRVRCPLCLKLVKNLDSVERLPVNHTIFAKMAEDLNTNGPPKTIPTLPGDRRHDKHAAQKEAMSNNFMAPPPQDMIQNVAGEEENELEACEYHFERIKHFYCLTHKVTCCRVCGEVMHSKGKCNLVDLYEVDDFEALINNDPGKKKLDFLAEMDDGGDKDSNKSV